MTDMQSYPAYPEPSGDLGHDAAPPPPKPAQRLRRSRQDRVLGGVCGGFAHYLNIDPVAIRIIMIALLFTGVGALAYLIAWIVIPSAEEGEPEPPAQPEARHRTAAIIGATLVAVGLVLILRSWMPMLHGMPFWPLLLVGAGVALAVSAFQRRR
jgi:phage shock protein C